LSLERLLSCIQRDLEDGDPKHDTPTYYSNDRMRSTNPSDINNDESDKSIGRLATIVFEVRPIAYPRSVNVSTPFRVDSRIKGVTGMLNHSHYQRDGRDTFGIRVGHDEDGCGLNMITSKGG
jgi:hypothetical protein